MIENMKNYLIMMVDYNQKYYHYMKKSLKRNGLNQEEKVQINGVSNNMWDLVNNMENKKRYRLASLAYKSSLEQFKYILMGQVAERKREDLVNEDGGLKTKHIHVYKKKRTVWIPTGKVSPNAWRFK